MADKEQITEAIKRLVAEQSGCGIEQVFPEAKLETLGFDSLDDIELVMAVEDEFSIQLSDEEGDRLCASNGTTVQAYIDLVAAKVPA